MLKREKPYDIVNNRYYIRKGAFLVYRISDFDKASQNMYRIGKTISIILYIIIIPIIIINVTLIIKTCLNPNEIPDFFGFKSFVIVSESMEPTIITGDAIFVKKVAQEDLKVNDIISFQDSNSVNTHRIIEITEEDDAIKYTTKGDNNQKEDKEKVTYDKIEGKYQFKINGFGKITEILKNKVTLIVLLIVLVFVSLYQMRLAKRKLIRKEKRYEYNKTLDRNRWL